MRLLHLAGAVVLTQGASSSTAQVTSKQSAIRSFKVGNSTFLGKAKTICSIEGKWADGSHFSYDAWDTCAKISITRGSQRELKDEESRGTDDRISGKDIPVDAEVIVISNNYSAVAIFRDRSGDQRELLFRD